MSLSVNQRNRIAAVVQGKLKQLLNEQDSRRDLTKMLAEDRTAPVPTERAANMVGRVNKNLVNRTVGDEAYDNVGLDAGSELVDRARKDVAKIIADTFKRYAIENEFGDTFSEADFRDFEESFPEIGEIEQELSADIAAAVSTYAMKIAELALEWTGADWPVSDEEMVDRKEARGL